MTCIFALRYCILAIFSVCRITNVPARGRSRHGGERSLRPRWDSSAKVWIDDADAKALALADEIIPSFPRFDVCGKQLEALQAGCWISLRLLTMAHQLKSTAGIRVGHAALCNRCSVPSRELWTTLSLQSA